MNPYFTNIVQIGVVVSDAAAVVKQLEQLLAWQPFGTRETMRIPGRTYHGKEEDFACRMYFYQFPTIELEIIEPLRGQSCWSDYLIANGNGVHHLLFDLHDSAPALAGLSSCGIEIEQRGRALPYGEHAFWAYLRSQEVLGFVMEVTNRSEKPQPQSLPDPLQGAFSRLRGVSIAVKNLESSLRAFRQILGWEAGHPYRVFGDRYLGDESNAASGAVLYPLKTLAVELIRPVCAPSCANEQMRQNGEGIFCIDFLVDSPDAVRLLTDEGVAVLEQGHTLMDGQMARWAILDTKELFGFALRAIYR